LPFALPQRHSGGHIKHVPKTDGRLASAFAGKTAGRNSCFGGLRLSLRPPGSISEEGTENKKKYSLKKSARPVFWCHQACPDAGSFDARLRAMQTDACSCSALYRPARFEIASRISSKKYCELTFVFFKRNFILHRGFEFPTQNIFN